MEGPNVVVESTGMYGSSKLKRYELSTGRTLNEVALPKAYFGEGAVAVNGIIYQMTYRERVIRLYREDTFELTEEISMPREIREGWGMTTDNTTIYVTDGSNNIYLINPDNFAVTKTLPIVNSDGRRVMNLNELEYINGELWANIYFSRRIAVIDAATGTVKYFVDLTGLGAVDETYHWNGGEVLNGIAYDGSRILVTGKYWRHIYAIAVN